ncbi:ECF transporter S component [Aerococcus vaginalis]
MNLKRAMILAMIVALNVAMAFFILIPVPATNGNINLCDAGIIFAALLYGKREGAIVGGLSGLLLDLVSGYAIFMPFSLVVHGLEGFAVGAIAKRDDNKSKALAIVVGAIIVVSLIPFATVSRLGFRDYSPIPFKPLSVAWSVSYCTISCTVYRKYRTVKQQHSNRKSVLSTR